MALNKSPKKKTRWLKEKRKKQEKEVWLGLKDDIVVVVMGQIGAGKSTFVDHLLQDVALEIRPAIGEELDSCTVDLEPFVIPNGENRIVIVDTPGFNDTFTTDSEIVRCIAEWLASSYSKDMKLDGVIYLHDMSQLRMLSTAWNKCEVLCGTDAAKAIVLGMTKSEELPRDVRKKREDQLQSKFWAEMIARGARTACFDNTSASAWEILCLVLGSRINEQLYPAILQIRNKPHLRNQNEFVEPHPLIHQIQNELVELENILASTTAGKNPLILRIQNELVELEKIIPSTTAGKKLGYTHEETRRMQENPAKALKSQSRDDQPLSAELKEKLDLIENLARQISHLSVPDGLWQHIKSFFHFAGKQNLTI